MIEACDGVDCGHEDGLTVAVHRQKYSSPSRARDDPWVVASKELLSTPVAHGNPALRCLEPEKCCISIVTLSLA